MTHAHMTTWAVALILFVVALFLQKGGNEKGAKIVKMVLRLFYLLIVATGLGLLFTSGMLKTDLALQYILKLIAGIWTIGSLEMVLSKLAKKQPVKILVIQLIVALVLTIYLGFKLPM